MSTKNVFISYKREDRPRVRELAESLRRAGNDVWFDESIQVGDHWWDTILARIEQCDVFVFAISQRALRSVPCRLENQYAAALGKPIRLVQVGALTAVPTEYATIQYGHFSKKDKDALIDLIDLIGAINRIPAGQPNNPNIEKPPPPIAPLDEIAAILDTQPEIEFKDQLALLYRLKEAASDPTTRAQGLRLVAVLQRKTRYTQIQTECDDLLNRYRTQQRRQFALSIVGLAAVSMIVLGIIGLAFANNQRSTTSTPLATTAVAALQPSATPPTTATFTPSWTFTPAPTLPPSPIPVGAALTPTVYARQTIKDVSFVWVPAGCFMMGSDKTKDSNANPDEQPQHKVCLTRGFWIGEFDITNAQFDAYVKATGAPHQVDSSCSATSSAPDQPVVCVSWDDAVGYAKWLGGRLPTEAEWEFAARGPVSPIYPWGNTFDGSKANTTGNGLGKTTIVGLYPAGASWVGAQDMAGNVWQWVADWYSDSYYQSSTPNDPTGPTSGQYRVLRGGSWYSNQGFARAASRSSYVPPDNRFDNIGFRVVCAAPVP
jgi:formylglycine-generating enzyme required for sulfatase activity